MAKEGSLNAEAEGHTEHSEWVGCGSAFWNSQELAGAGRVEDVRETDIPGPVWFLACTLSKMGAAAGL